MAVGLILCCVTVGPADREGTKMNDRKVIELEQGWEFMGKGITKLKRILEGLPEPPFNSEDYMMLYT